MHDIFRHFNFVIWDIMNSTVYCFALQIIYSIFIHFVVVVVVDADDACNNHVHGIKIWCS